MQMQTLEAYAQMKSQHTQDTTPVDSLLQRRLSASSRFFYWLIWLQMFLTT